MTLTATKNSQKVINVCKKPGRKDAVRVNGIDDIPDFLRETIRIDGDELVLVCVEGTERCPRGSVVGYEKSDNTPTGYNTWCITKWKELLLEPEPGIFYKKTPVLQAMPVTTEFPALLEGAKIDRDEGESKWHLHASWGIQDAPIGAAFWVLYGYTDGKPDCACVALSEKSAAEYMVCDPDGNVKESLIDYAKRELGWKPNPTA